MTSPIPKTNLNEREAARVVLLEEVAAKRIELARKFHRNERGVQLSFDQRFSFQRDMYKDAARRVVVVGCVQKGKTEWAMITAMATVMQEDAMNVLYIMPDRGSLSKFIETKFDPCKSNTPHYKGLIRDTDNKHVKQIGNGFVTFGISSREADFANVTCDLAIIDELELCSQSNLRLVADRMEESLVKASIVVSNPRHRGGPIEVEFNKSDQKHWHADCPQCGKACKVGWFESVVQPRGDWYELRSKDGRARAVCDKCAAWLDVQGGYWKAENPDSEISGYRLNHVMASSDLDEMWHEFVEAKDDQTAMQRFYNSKCGLAYTAPGAGITREMLDAIREPRRPKVGSISAGIDLHGHDQTIVILSEAGAQPHVAHYEKCRSTEDTAALLDRWGVERVISDAEPGGYFVREWAEGQRSKGVRVALARNQESLYGFQPKLDDASGEMRFHRTMLLDDAWAHVKEKRITIAPDLPEEFFDELCYSTRYLDIDSEPAVYRWTKGSNHAMFSLAFALVASRMLGTAAGITFRGTKVDVPRPGGF